MSAADRQTRAARAISPVVTPAPDAATRSTLQPTPDGTLLRLVHRGLPSPEACAAHEEGWKHYVQRLAVRAEGRDPGPDHWM
ncbi:SRPBCC domain-containing protein [Streptomyces canus]|uniref:SRPBCC domain-containing protein n=1 Tax=Streptomyces canus TaxID=58343 RepID=UPI0036EF8D75